MILKSSSNAFLFSLIPSRKKWLLLSTSLTFSLNTEWRSHLLKEYQWQKKKKGGVGEQLQYQCLKWIIKLQNNTLIRNIYILIKRNSIFEMKKFIWLSMLSIFLHFCCICDRGRYSIADLFVGKCLWYYIVLRKQIHFSRIMTIGHIFYSKNF